MTAPFADREFADLFQTLPGVAIMMVRADGTIDYANDAEGALYESSPGPSQVGKRLADLYHPDFVAERLEWIRHVLSTRQPLVVDYLYRGRPVTATFFPISRGDGSARVVVVSRHRTPFDVDPNHLRRVRSRVVDLGRLGLLSQRELEVFVLLGHGMSVPQVAERLQRSPKTIEQHKSAIGRKLGDSTLAGITKNVVESGIDEKHLREQVIDVFRLDARPPQGEGSN